MVEGATGGGRPELVAGRYRIVGSGAAGPATAVLDGYDERLGRPVVLEVLRPEWAADPGMRQAFATAAYRAARIQHHQVMRTFDVASHDGTAYVVTDMARGGTLAQRLDGGLLSDASARRLGLAVLSGLDAAHRSEVLHLDLSPANVVFDDHGTVQVARFGILDALYRAAREDGRPGPAAGPGPNRMVLPVPLARRAPECAAGAEPTAAADFWSVGALLYRALTGTFPPARAVGADPGSVSSSLVARRPGTDRRLAATVGRALDPRPEHRFESAAEMAEAMAGPARPVVSPGFAAPAAAVAADTGSHHVLTRTERHAAVAPPRRLAGLRRRAPGAGAGAGGGSRRGWTVGVLGAGVAAAVAGGILIPALLHSGGDPPAAIEAPAAASAAPSTTVAPGGGAATTSPTSAPIPTPTTLAAVDAPSVVSTTAASPVITVAPPPTAVAVTTTTVAPAPGTTTTVPATTTTTVPATTTTTVPATTTTTVPATTTTVTPAATATTAPSKG